jgi:ribose 5-phosphate isomerase A
MPGTLSDKDAASLAAHALGFVGAGHVIGLGTGRAATAFVRALGSAVDSGLRVTGVPTSEATGTLARELGIPLITLDERTVIDLSVDGADEVDPRLDLIKGYGGALLREKVVAAASRRLVILVGREKVVERLGSRGKLPVEVAPFAVGFCRARLAEMGLAARLRRTDAAPFRTDNGNHVLDCAVEPFADARALDARVRAIPGIVATGLFVGMAHTVLVGDEGRITSMTRP